MMIVEGKQMWISNYTETFFGGGVTIEEEI